MAAVKSHLFLLNLRAMFYMVTPNETAVENVDDVPNYVDETIPYFTLFIFVECIVLKMQGKDLPRINDGINSMSHGVLSILHALLFRSFELVVYVWIYDNYHFVDLPWDSPWTWILGFLGVDFLYYWFHRISHESNIVWASHQVHHSSEEYNLTTALRQSLMQKYYSMFLYFPLALLVPPSIFYIHQQFNLLYQFWIHTEVVDRLGPLEYILNTPSHHRVHHGRNPYCIDKNYAGTLIIWDRIFNTFQPEGEKVVYGLVHPNQFWNPVLGQFYHYLYILGLVKQHKGIANKISAVLKGPGWEPGKPWRGLYEDLPEIAQPVRKYNSNLPLWGNIYILIHFMMVVTGYGLVIPYKTELPFITSLGCVIFFVYTLSVFAALYDHRRYSSFMECLRCIIFMLVNYYARVSLMFQPSWLTLVDIIFLLSAILWGILIVMQYDVNTVAKKLI